MYLPMCTSSRYEQHQSTSHIGCTTSTQLIQRKKQPKISPTKQLINFILPLADTVLEDSKYQGRYVYLIVKYLFSSPSCNTKQEKKTTCSCAQIFFLSSDYVHVVVVSCKVALHGKTEDFFLVYGPCSKYKVLPLRTCRYT